MFDSNDNYGLENDYNQVGYNETNNTLLVTLDELNARAQQRKIKLQAFGQMLSRKPDPHAGEVMPLTSAGSRSNQVDSRS